MSLEYKVLGQELVSYTDLEGTTDTTSYYVSYEETVGPLFVAINRLNSSIATSTDGITWTQASLPSISSSYSWLSITYGANKFVAVASYSNSAYSINGTTWTSTPMPSSRFWSSVTYGGDKFVAIAGYSSLGAVAYSTDGITWNSSSFPAYAGWSSVTYGGDKFVAVSASQRTAAYSPDGITWTLFDMPESAAWRSVTYGNGKFVATASDNNSTTAAYSTDGITWTSTTLPSQANWWSVTHGDNKFVAVGNSADPSAAYSTDGITWTAANLPGYNDWFSVTYGNDKFVAISRYSTTAAYSTDAIAWTLTTLPAYGTWRSLAFGQAIQLTETLNIIGGQGTSQTEEFLPVTVYTVPTGKQTTVTSIFVANHDDTDSTYDLAVVPAGEELSLKHHIRWDMAVAANDFENISTKITMSAGDKLVIFPSTVDTVSITAFGVEK